MKLAELTGRRVRKAAAKLRDLLGDLTEDGDPEILHRARTQLRRLRVALREGSACLPDLDTRPLKRFWRASGKVRDLDVILGRLGALGDEAADAVAVCWQQRAEQWALLAASRGKDLDRLLRRLAEIEPSGPGKVKATRRKALARHAKRLQRLDASADAPAAELHALRLAVKRARYTCAFYKDPRQKALRQCQGRLGAIQDAVVLMQWLEDVDVTASVRRRVEQDAQEAMVRATSMGQALQVPWTPTPDPAPQRR